MANDQSVFQDMLDEYVWLWNLLLNVDLSHGLEKSMELQ